MNKKVIILSAPSGSGKTTLAKFLFSQLPQLEFSISATTRSPRLGETEAKDYYFLPKEEFDERIAKNEFVEWEEVYAGTKYGTLKQEVDRIWEERKVVLFDVDVVGGINLKEQFNDHALSIFIMPPSVDALKDRLTKRGTESNEDLKKRIQKSTEELTYSSDFDTTIVNDDLEVAKLEILKVVKDFIQN